MNEKGHTFHAQRTEDQKQMLHQRHFSSDDDHWILDDEISSMMDKIKSQPPSKILPDDKNCEKIELESTSSIDSLTLELTFLFSRYRPKRI